MKRIDFINLVTTYASHFREIDANESVDKTLTNFVNFVAANQGINYGMYADELAKHKKRVYNPADSSIITNMGKKISDMEFALKTIYTNTESPRIKWVIEDLANKYGGELEQIINSHKD
jgi:hypothetical protein